MWGKVPAHDGIPSESIKYKENAGQELLQTVMNNILKRGSIAKSWKLAILPIFKSGNTRVCSNHRGNSLLNVTEKVYESPRGKAKRKYSRTVGESTTRIQFFVSKNCVCAS